MSIKTYLFKFPPVFLKYLSANLTISADEATRERLSGEMYSSVAHASVEFRLIHFITPNQQSNNSCAKSTRVCSELQLANQAIFKAKCKITTVEEVSVNTFEFSSVQFK